METASELYKCLKCGKVVSTHNRSGFCSECKSTLNRNERRAITLKAYRQYEKEDKEYQPGPAIENSFDCRACKGVIAASDPCRICNDTRCIALYAEEKCKERVREKCNMHGAYIGCIQGYVKRLCDTDKGIYKRLLTSEELKVFMSIGDQVGGGMDYIIDMILKTDNAKIKGKPVRLMSIEARK